MEVTILMITAFLMEIIRLIFTFKGLVLIGIFYAIRVLRHIRKLLSTQVFSLVYDEIEKEKKQEEEEVEKAYIHKEASLNPVKKGIDEWYNQGSSIARAKQAEDEFSYDDYVKKLRLERKQKEDDLFFPEKM